MTSKASSVDELVELIVDPMKAGLAAVEKKIRNLEKKKSKLDALRDEVKKSGKPLNEDQSQALARYEDNNQQLDTFRELKTSFQGCIDDVRKSSRKMLKKEQACENSRLIELERYRAVARLMESDEMQMKAIEESEEVSETMRDNLKLLRQVLLPARSDFVPSETARTFEDYLKGLAEQQGNLLHGRPVQLGETEVKEPKLFLDGLVRSPFLAEHLFASAPHSASCAHCHAKLNKDLSFSNQHLQPVQQRQRASSGMSATGSASGRIIAAATVSVPHSQTSFEDYQPGLTVQFSNSKMSGSGASSTAGTAGISGVGAVGSGLTSSSLSHSQVPVSAVSSHFQGIIPKGNLTGNASAALYSDDHRISSSVGVLQRESHGTTNHTMPQPAVPASVTSSNKMDSSYMSHPAGTSPNQQFGQRAGERRDHQENGVFSAVAQGQSAWENRIGTFDPKNPHGDKEGQYSPTNEHLDKGSDEGFPSRGAAGSNSADDGPGGFGNGGFRGRGRGRGGGPPFDMYRGDRRSFDDGRQNRTEFSRANFPDQRRPVPGGMPFNSNNNDRSLPRDQNRLPAPIVAGPPPGRFTGPAAGDSRALRPIGKDQLEQNGTNGAGDAMEAKKSTPSGMSESSHTDFGVFHVDNPGFKGRTGLEPDRRNHMNQYAERDRERDRERPGQMGSQGPGYNNRPGGRVGRIYT